MRNKKKSLEEHVDALTNKVEDNQSSLSLTMFDVPTERASELSQEVNDTIQRVCEQGNEEDHVGISDMWNAGMYNIGNTPDEKQWVAYHYGFQSADMMYRQDPMDIIRNMMRGLPDV